MRRKVRLTERRLRNIITKATRKILREWYDIPSADDPSPEEMEAYGSDLRNYRDELNNALGEPHYTEEDFMEDEWDDVDKIASLNSDRREAGTNPTFRNLKKAQIDRAWSERDQADRDDNYAFLRNDFDDEINQTNWNVYDDDGWNAMYDWDAADAERNANESIRRRIKRIVSETFNRTLNEWDYDNDLDYDRINSQAYHYLQTHPDVNFLSWRKIAQGIGIRMETIGPNDRETLKDAIEDAMMEFGSPENSAERDYYNK